MSGDSGAADQGGTGGANNGSTGGSGTDSNKLGVGNENSKDAFQPVTYKSQEELDAAFAERASRAAESAKKEALKFLPEGADPNKLVEVYNAWKEEEDKKKGPEALERERREAAERELKQYKDREARATLSREVAKDLKIGETPIPSELLHGSTKEEMEAHGKAIISFVQEALKTVTRAPGYNPNQGHSGEGAPSAGDPIRNLFMTGSFS